MHRCLVWRMAMHACQIGPTESHPVAQDCHYGPASGQRGEHFGAGNLSALISLLLLKYADDATTLSLRFGIDQDLRISGLDGKLAAGCPRSGPAWIVFCFHCCVADGQNREMARSSIGCWVVVAMGRHCHSRTISIFRRIVRVTKAATWSHPSALFSIIGTNFPA